MASENWLPIVGYEGWYEVSDTGRIRSVDRMVHAINPHGKMAVRHFRGRELKRFLTAGYPSATLAKNSVTETVYSHEAMLRAFVGERPEGLVIRHRDGDPLHCDLENVVYGTWSDNHLDWHFHKINPGKVRL